MSQGNDDLSWLDPATYDEIAGPEKEEEEVRFAPTILTFEREPDCFYPGEGKIIYRGQDRPKARLDRRIRVLAPTGRIQRIKTLLVGSAGLGKTTLARITAKRIQDRWSELGITPGSYYELLPSQVGTKDLLDRFMLEVVNHPYAQVFIDELHALENLEVFFHFLHDTGVKRYPLDGGWVVVPDTISWLTATTDPGELDKRMDGALRRRLQPEIRLEAPTKEVLRQIILDTGDADGVRVDAEAATFLAGRALFPWQAKYIYDESYIGMELLGSRVLTVEQAEEACEIIGLDEQGLLPEDRDVLRALMQVPYRLASNPEVTRYRMSEEALCSASGVDKLTYKKRVQPKLLRLGYITTVGGQSLQDKALHDYGWLMGD